MVKRAKASVDIVPLTVDEQEHLSLERLKKLTTTPALHSRRPENSFPELMEWVISNFSDALKDQIGLHKFVHNRIVIDGEFMHYADLNKVQIETLYNDAFISWKASEDKEKFFCQGVFRVSKPGLEFLTAALYQKGQQFEDEISFFTIVSEKNYDRYLKFRNEFDEWVSARDRAHLHIRVIDGEDICYSRDQSWDDLFLPKEMKTEIISLVENFLDGRDFYESNRLPWKKGVLLYGPPGNGKSSIIRTIISNFDFKPITIAAGAGDEAMFEAFAFAEQEAPALLYMEDLDSILDRYIDTSSLLNLLDGIATRDGLLFIATANDISRLKTSLTDRPGRIDHKFEIPLPDAKMLSLYLQKWFGSFFSIKRINQLAEEMAKIKMSYAYARELYIATMFEAISHNRKVPNEKDLTKTLQRLLKDKNMMKVRSIDTGRYLG